MFDKLCQLYSAFKYNCVRNYCSIIYVCILHQSVIAYINVTNCVITISLGYSNYKLILYDFDSPLSFFLPFLGLVSKKLGHEVQCWRALIELSVSAHSRGPWHHRSVPWVSARYRGQPSSFRVMFLLYSAGVICAWVRSK